MLKKIKKVELIKITDGTDDITQAAFEAAVAGQDVTTEYKYEQFLISQGWQEYVSKELKIGEPNSGVTWKNTTANPAQNIIVNEVTTAAAPTIRVYPTPDASPEYYLLKIYYMREPDEVTATTDTLELPTNAKEALKFYVAAQALLAEQDQQDYAKAEIMMGLYEKHLRSLRQTIQAYQHDDYSMDYRR